ncbi:ParB N-terminal domain-containing protein [Lysinibacillus sp. 1 U-2021]|uniref:ParB/RepB/Spo0J family partition protein n=1 Tax=Lysinibacillus sp. 1 U-2021 TaxID=3039426 RepID=UPI0024801EE2|nr:ParB N-terminal domain-containing protein [Lysinibacillus sp. 1 U-2021]WGT38272.1 ParB N-terminal domain-containing protein [Lysinibacillus sp. 1 U-2021]
MSKFNLSQLMNTESKKQSVAFKIEHIQLERIKPSPKNSYSVDDVSELKSSIELLGLQQNLVVRIKDDGAYELISGHRRLKAMQELRSEGNSDFEKAPCKIIKSTDDIQAELQLILANSTTRVLTDAEKTKQAARLHELLQKMQSEGYQLEGRKREIVANLMGVSSAQVQRMDSINKNLTPELKDEFVKENINITTAYELSRLPEEAQKEAVQESVEQGKPLTPAIAKAKRQEIIESEQKEKPMTHELDSYIEQFEEIVKGLKTFMCGFDNRSFRVGDILKINEFDRDEILYTGRFIEVKVIYLQKGGENGLPEDFVIMSIKKIR